MRLASGVMRVADVRNAGIRIGMGLDGGTNDTADVFNNMRAGVGLQRAVTLDSHVTPTVADVLRMATMGGAETLDQDDKIGSLTPGKQADVVVIRCDHMNTYPVIDPVSTVVQQADTRNVETVFVAGKALKRDGKLVGADLGRARSLAASSLEHLLHHTTVQPHWVQSRTPAGHAH
jgi:5-methylthioadenosine/S-adenosylhomocysteine deaminase